jgi:hypothetical protein
MTHRFSLNPLVFRVLWGLLPWLGWVAGCSTGPVEISDQPLAGQIGGAEWTLGSAETNAVLSADFSTFFVAAYGQALAPCTGAGSATSGNQLILSIPKVAGEYPLGLALKQTFYVPATNTNYVSSLGRLVVHEVTSTTISAGAHFLFDQANEVDGQFTVTICD